MLHGRAQLWNQRQLTKSKEWGRVNLTIQQVIKTNLWIFSFPLATEVTVNAFNSIILEILQFEFAAYLKR